jgi:mRNA interferase MazF
LGKIKRGEIYWVDLNPAKGSEQKKKRPVLIVQNDIGNTYSPTTIGVVLTSEYEEKNKSIPTNVFIIKDILNKLDSDSLLETSQIRVLDVRQRIGDRIGVLDRTNMIKVDKALKVSLELIEKCSNCNYMLINEVEECPKCKMKVRNKCGKCNKLLDVLWNYCPYCGKEIKL